MPPKKSSAPPGPRVNTRSQRPPPPPTSTPASPPAPTTQPDQPRRPSAPLAVQRGPVTRSPAATPSSIQPVRPSRPGASMLMFPDNSGNRVIFQSREWTVRQIGQYLLNSNHDARERAVWYNNFADAARSSDDTQSIFLANLEDFLKSDSAFTSNIQKGQAAAARGRTARDRLNKNINFIKNLFGDEWYSWYFEPYMSTPIADEFVRHRAAIEAAFADEDDAARAAFQITQSIMSAWAKRLADYVHKDKSSTGTGRGSNLEPTMQRQDVTNGLPANTDAESATRKLERLKDDGTGPAGLPAQYYNKIAAPGSRVTPKRLGLMKDIHGFFHMDQIPDARLLMRSTYSNLPMPQPGPRLREIPSTPKAKSRPAIGTPHTPEAPPKLLQPAFTPGTPQTAKKRQPAPEPATPGTAGASSPASVQSPSLPPGSSPSAPDRRGPNQLVSRPPASIQSPPSRHVSSPPAASHPSPSRPAPGHSAPTQPSTPAHRRKGSTASHAESVDTQKEYRPPGTPMTPQVRRPVSILSRLSETPSGSIQQRVQELTSRLEKQKLAGQLAQLPPVAEGPSPSAIARGSPPPRPAKFSPDATILLPKDRASKLEREIVDWIEKVAKSLEPGQNIDVRQLQTNFSDYPPAQVQEAIRNITQIAMGIKTATSEGQSLTVEQRTIVNTCLVAFFGAAFWNAPPPPPWEMQVRLLLSRILSFASAYGATMTPITLATDIAGHEVLWRASDFREDVWTLHGENHGWLFNDDVVRMTRLEIASPDNPNGRVQQVIDSSVLDVAINTRATDPQHRNQVHIVPGVRELFVVQHNNNHFSLHVVDLHTGEFRVFDSFGVIDRVMVNRTRTWLAQARPDLRLQPPARQDAPRQSNSSDCGLWVIANARAWANWRRAATDMTTGALRVHTLQDVERVYRRRLEHHIEAHGLTGTAFASPTASAVNSPLVSPVPSRAPTASPSSPSRSPLPRSASFVSDTSSKRPSLLSQAVRASTEKRASRMSDIEMANPTPSPPFGSPMELSREASPMNIDSPPSVAATTPVPPTRGVPPSPSLPSNITHPGTPSLTPGQPVYAPNVARWYILDDHLQPNQRVVCTTLMAKKWYRENKLAFPGAR